MKAQLQKLMKEKQTLDSEGEKIQESILANSRSFPQAIHSTLINSNKWKYLTIYGKEVVPLTKVINFDISVLQKHYNNHVPDDLVRESELFESIINMYDTKVCSAMNTLEMKLKNSVREIDNCIKKTEVKNILQPVAMSVLTSTPTSKQNNLERYMSSGSGYIANDLSILKMPTPMSQVTQHFTCTPSVNIPSHTQTYENYAKTTQAISNPKKQSDYGEHYCVSPFKKICQPSSSHDTIDMGHINGASAFGEWHRPPPQVSMQQGNFSTQHYPVSKPLTCKYSLDSGQQLQNAILEVKPEYFLTYDQFNIKLKTKLATHYIAESATDIKLTNALNVLDLD